MDAAILGAHVIAYLMQPDTAGQHLARFIDLVCEYFQGKSGEDVTKGDLQTSRNLRNAYKDFMARQAAGKGIRTNSLLVNLLKVYQATRALTLSGDPDRDWLAIRDILLNGACDRLRGIVQEVRNVRLLDRGTILRESLSQDWRENGAYRDALEIVRQAFLLEHFATNSKPETGVVVMNMHKAKGKQFDEVIIFEGWPRRNKKKEIVANLDRIVRSNLVGNIDEETRQNFRVAITRAKQKTLILTPHGDPCVLLRGQD